MLNTTCAHRFRQVSMAVREGMASGSYPYGHASRAGTTAVRTVHLWCSAPHRDHGPAPRARAGIGLRLDILMGTLSKSFGSSGGFIAASREVCDYARHSAHGYIFNFPGHGSQYLDRLADLRRSDPTVAAALDEAVALYQARHRSPLSDNIYTDLGAAAATLSQPTATQCAIFTASVAQYRRLLTIAASPAIRHQPRRDYTLSTEPETVQCGRSQALASLWTAR